MTLFLLKRLATLAATLLGITARTIYRREAEWALESEHGASAAAVDDDV